jgi:hypothetical protein
MGFLVIVGTIGKEEEGGIEERRRREEAGTPTQKW